MTDYPDKLSLSVFADVTDTTLMQAEKRTSRYMRTFLIMKPWLPTGEVKNFLDIGCGLGGVAMLVASHYPNATAHLLDGDEYTEKWTGYRTDGKPFADAKIAASLFAKYCPGREARVWPANPKVEVPLCELIYSTCSWGHHYPIETYLDVLCRCLRPGGTVIVDLRLGEVGDHGRRVLGEYLSHVADVYSGEGKKYTRTVWKSAVL